MNWKLKTLLNKLSYEVTHATLVATFRQSVCNMKLQFKKCNHIGGNNSGNMVLGV